MTHDTEKGPPPFHCPDDGGWIKQVSNYEWLCPKCGRTWIWVPEDP